MSHHSDDAMPMPGSDSFWEPGNYKKTTKRTEDGSKLCNDLVMLIKERADIEQAYAKSLRGWSKKWLDIIEKGVEYGTTASAWKGVCNEAEKRCVLHNNIRDSLLQDVVPKIKNWQKDNFHKTMIQLKEKKEFDDAFKKAQKPWSKCLAKVNKCKTDYHNACKNEKSIVNQERNASGDTSLSPDQVKKLQDRVAKAKDEVQKTKEKYEQSLREINEYNPKYMEDMTTVFEKCQEFEEKRLKFFKEMLFSIHGCLNISNMPDVVRIYEEYRHTIQSADASKDLKYWSNTHGVGMAMNWPIFEDYCEEFREIISTKTKKNGTGPTENGITLVNQHKFTEELPEYNHELSSLSKRDKTKFNANNGFEDNGVVLIERSNLRNEGEGGDYYPEKREHTSGANGGGPEQWRLSEHRRQEDKLEENPFEDEQEDWDDYPNEALVDNGEPGVAVRALYDYEGAEADELTFKQGDVFEKLEDEDEQGWCKGRKDGRVGLYPANYIELITG
ncbi:Protein kinase C and casein kinase substrate [Tyrophagus putrescentiae]|nr:Protein kinase C and casein kinase substrate [Tyrophagus putrescentiae]